MKYFTVIAVLFFTCFNAIAKDEAIDALGRDVQGVRSAVLALFKPSAADGQVSRLADRMHMQDVDVLSFDSGAQCNAHYFPGVILVGHACATLPEGVLAFILAHEYGHHMHEHWKTNLSRGLSVAQLQGKTVQTVLDVLPYVHESRTTDINHAQEYEADAQAVTLVRYFQLYDAVGIRRFLEQSGAASSSHPAGLDRVERAGVR